MSVRVPKRISANASLPNQPFNAMNRFSSLQKEIEAVKQKQEELRQTDSQTPSSFFVSHKVQQQTQQFHSSFNSLSSNQEPASKRTATESESVRDSNSQTVEANKLRDRIEKMLNRFEVSISPQSQKRCQRSSFDTTLSPGKQASSGKNESTFVHQIEKYKILVEQYQRLLQENQESHTQKVSDLQQQIANINNTVKAQREELQSQRMRNQLLEELNQSSYNRILSLQNDLILQTTNHKQIINELQLKLNLPTDNNLKTDSPNISTTILTDDLQRQIYELQQQLQKQKLEQQSNYINLSKQLDESRITLQQKQNDQQALIQDLEVTKQKQQKSEEQLQAKDTEIVNLKKKLQHKKSSSSFSIVQAYSLDFQPKASANSDPEIQDLKLQLTQKDAQIKGLQQRLRQAKPESHAQSAKIFEKSAELIHILSLQKKELEETCLQLMNEKNDLEARVGKSKDDSSNKPQFHSRQASVNQLFPKRDYIVEEDNHNRLHKFDAQAPRSRHDSFKEQRS